MGIFEINMVEENVQDNIQIRNKVEGLSTQELVSNMVDKAENNSETESINNNKIVQNIDEIDVKGVFDLIKTNHPEFKFPNYEDFNKEFEIEGIDIENPIQEMRKKVIDKLETYSKILSEIFQPDGDLNSLIESHFLKEVDNDNKLFEIYKKVRYFIRRGQRIGLINDQKEDISLTIDAYKEVIEFKTSIVEFLKILEKGWLTNSSKEELVGYFG